MMIIGLGVPLFFWALAIVPGLPRSVYLYEFGRLLGLMPLVHAASIRVGAGIVHDSVPTTEFEETEHKANSCLRAIRGD